MSIFRGWTVHQSPDCAVLNGVFCVAAGSSEDGLPAGAGERGGGEHDQTVQPVHQVRCFYGRDQPHGGGLLWHRYAHTLRISSLIWSTVWVHLNPHDPPRHDLIWQCFPSDPVLLCCIQEHTTATEELWIVRFTHVFTWSVWHLQGSGASDSCRNKCGRMSLTQDAAQIRHGQRWSSRATVLLIFQPSLPRPSADYYDQVCSASRKL